MVNPYELIFDRLGNIETILLDLKHPCPKQTPATKNKMRLREVAERLGMAECSLYPIIKAGKLYATKPNKHWLVSEESLEAYIKGEKHIQVQSVDEDPSTFLLRNKKAAK